MAQKTTAKSLGVDPKEWRRLRKLTLFEEAARSQGFGMIAGVDEAGRGPLAGPVVACACIIPEGIYFPGINDSKKLTPDQRKELYCKITEDPRISYGVGVVSHEVIDKINIYQATIQAMLQAIEQVIPKPDYLLVDGLKLPHLTIPAQKIIEGDAKAHSISAASIIAKETRDRLMQAYHVDYPHYGFNQHKGYATRQHLLAIEQHGPCSIHRRTFSPFNLQQVSLQLELF